MIDTHTHLYMDAFSGEEAETVRKAIAAGVTMMIFPGVSMESHEAMMELHRQFPENTRVALGLHPTELGEGWRKTLDEMESLLDDGGFSAIGEIGIDLHWDAGNVADQKEAFARQLEWAQRCDLPVIIHCRDGVEETLDVLKNIKGKLPKLIFHSFTSGPEDVRRIREVCDPWFGINGVVTFKNAKPLREALPLIGLDRIALETDAPYLAPTPHRGERNDTSFIPLILAQVSETLGIPKEEVEKQTDLNAKAIFDL